MKENQQKRKNLSRREFVTAAATGLTASALAAVEPTTGHAAQVAGMVPKHWDLQADIVIIGAGATGLCAAIEAIENGASVIAVDANTDVGGHAIVSGGNIALGGGTTRQEKYGVKDSPDLLFADLTDWSVVEPNGFPDYRYNDKEVIRAFADNSAATCEWLMKHGVIFVEKTPGQRRSARHGKFRAARKPLRAHAVAADADRRDRLPRKGRPPLRPGSVLFGRWRRRPESLARKFCSSTG